MKLLDTGLVGLLLLCTGCEDAVYCTLEIRSPLTGTVQDEAGNDVIPDAVTVRVGKNPVRSCYVDFPARYACPEAPPGRAEVQVTLGDRTWTRPIRTRDEPDGCHNAEQQLDFVLDGVTGCEPTIAVSGSLLGPGAGAAGPAQIWLARLDGGQLHTSTPCAISGQRYECPAIGYYMTREYQLSLNAQNTNLDVKLTIPAQGCVITPVRHDFTLGR